MNASRQRAASSKGPGAPPDQGPQGLRDRIAYLEESALYISELANCVHEHSDVFWRIADNLHAEVARLKKSLREKAGAS